MDEGEKKKGFCGVKVVYNLHLQCVTVIQSEWDLHKYVYQLTPLSICLFVGIHLGSSTCYP